MQHYKYGFEDVRDDCKTKLLYLLKKYGILSVLLSIKNMPGGSELNLPAMPSDYPVILMGQEGDRVIRLMRGKVGDAGILEYLSELVDEHPIPGSITIDRVAWGRIATYLKAESERILSLGLREMKNSFVGTSAVQPFGTGKDFFLTFYPRMKIGKLSYFGG